MTKGEPGAMRDQDKKRGYQGRPKKSWRDKIDRFPGFTEGDDDGMATILDVIRRKATPATLTDGVHGAIALLFELGMTYAAGQRDERSTTPLTQEEADIRRVLRGVRKTLDEFAIRRRQRRTRALSALLLGGLIQIYKDRGLTAEERRPLIQDLWTTHGLILFPEDLDKLALSKTEISKVGRGPVNAAHVQLGKVLKRSPVALGKRRKGKARSGATAYPFGTPELTSKVIGDVFAKKFEWPPQAAKKAAAFWTCLLENAPASPSDYSLSLDDVEAINRALEGTDETPEGPANVAEPSTSQRRLQSKNRTRRKAGTSKRRRS